MVLGETLDRQQHGDRWRYVVKTGNRDFAAPDFRVIVSQGEAQTRRPAEVLVLQRRSGGNAYGWLVELREDNEVLTARPRCTAAAAAEAGA